MKRQGFTLIEMAIVLFIISLLILIILPNLMSQRERAQKVHRGAMVTMIQTQVDLYRDDHHNSHPDLNALVADGYLTHGQASEAVQEHIKIDDNHVQ